MFIIYILVGIFLFFIGMQISMVILAKKSKGIRLSGLSASLKKLEGNDSKGLVYFHSPQCHACKTQTPIIKKLQDSYKNLYDVDISKDFAAAKAFGIKATPTLIQVENGTVKDVFLGAKREHEIVSILAHM